MKKILLTALVLLVSVSLFACHTKKGSNDMSELFDEKPTNGQVTEAPNNNGKAEESPSTSDISSEADKESTEADKAEDKTEEEENSEAESEEKKEEAENPPTPFTLSDSELQTIKSRYIEAEDFYYTMLYQHLELDSYDVIVRKNSDGYDTEYHRLLYYNVNSLADLKRYYGEYFTQGFVNGLDFSLYAEENGKLYCAETENAPAASGVKYIYSVEGIDAENAYIVKSRTDGSSPQKIKCVKLGGVWYFSGVAIS
ncbi:MAG: hypothetical protein IKU43_04835 [Clostridia bacterium]|nr:hypothetical protein [Clostridia bacterium]